MAINIAHRPDLDRRVEALASRLGLHGKGRKTRVIERALEGLEARLQKRQPSKEEIDAALAKYAKAAKAIRESLGKQYSAMDAEALSCSLQAEPYDDHGTPK